MRKQLLFLWLAALFCGAAAQAADRSANVLLLASFPSCIEKKLEQVSVSAGQQEPSLNTGMNPVGVSYRMVFNKLLAAAALKGGNAVILQGHRADYFSKGARRPTRPTYVTLRGKVVLLNDDQEQCPMNVIDPLEFERDARERQRLELQKGAGFSF